MYNADHLTITTFLLMCEIQWLLNMSINPSIVLTLSPHFNQNQSVTQHYQKAPENQCSHVHHKYVSLTSWIINYRSRKSRSSGSLRQDRTLWNLRYYNMEKGFIQETGKVIAWAAKLKMRTKIRFKIQLSVPESFHIFMNLLPSTPQTSECRVKFSSLRYKYLGVDTSVITRTKINKLKIDNSSTTNCCPPPAPAMERQTGKYIAYWKKKARRKPCI